MTRAKIHLFELEDEYCPAFHALEQAHDVRYSPAPLTDDNVGEHEDAEVVSVFIASRLSAAAIAKLPSLRLIATRSTGFDHIDRRACEARGVKVANVPSYGDNTVAEHAFALLLALSRNLVLAAVRVRGGSFSRAGLRGVDLAGKTLGVIGTGDIGRRMAQIARGFDMRVLAFDLAPDQALAREHDVRYVALDQLLQTSEFVSLHVPLNDGTRGLLGRDRLAMMRPGAVLINTARGELVDAAALVELLHAGHLGGAGLDVLAEESALGETGELVQRAFHEHAELRTLVAGQALLRMPNVIVTPHIAFDTREAIGRLVATTAANIAAFVRGEPLNLVVGGEDQGA